MIRQPLTSSAFYGLPLLAQVPLFKDCEDAFITQLVMRLKMGVFLPGEVIFNIGDVGHEMYFITKGYVAVMNRWAGAGAGACGC